MQSVWNYLDKQFTGMISLSHNDEANKSARIGYWMGREVRRRGICSQAFDQVIEKARGLRLTSVSSTISKTNHASISIWEKRNAARMEISKRR